MTIVERPMSRLTRISRIKDCSTHGCARAYSFAVNFVAHNAFTCNSYTRVKFEASGKWVCVIPCIFSFGISSCAKELRNPVSPSPSRIGNPPQVTSSLSIIISLYSYVIKLLWKFITNMRHLASVISSNPWSLWGDVLLGTFSNQKLPA